MTSHAWTARSAWTVRLSETEVTWPQVAWVAAAGFFLLALSEVRNLGGAFGVGAVQPSWTGYAADVLTIVGWTFVLCAVASAEQTARSTATGLRSLLRLAVVGILLLTLASCASLVYDVVSHLGAPPFAEILNISRVYLATCVAGWACLGAGVLVALSRHGGTRVPARFRDALTIFGWATAANVAGYSAGFVAFWVPRFQRGTGGANLLYGGQAVGWLLVSGALVAAFVAAPGPRRRVVGLLVCALGAVLLATAVTLLLVALHGASSLDVERAGSACRVAGWLAGCGGAALLALEATAARGRRVVVWPTTVRVAEPEPAWSVASVAREGGTTRRGEEA